MEKEYKSGSKKKKAIAIALSAALVVGAGVGVGLGVGLSQNDGPKKLVEFVAAGETITEVYKEDGTKVEISDLKAGDKICFPMPSETVKTEGETTKYFAGWTSEKDAEEPEYFVGDAFITITTKNQKFYPVYMAATTGAALEYTDVNPGEETEHCTVAYTGTGVPSNGIVVIPNVYEGKKVASITARKNIAEAETDEALVRVIIADGIEEVGASAFQGCSKLVSVVFSTESYHYTENVGGVETQTTVSEESTLTTIGDNAFKGCAALATVSIPSSVTAIGEGAFANCSELNSVYIPAGVTEIKAYTFLGCAKLSEVEYESKTALTRIGYSAFDGTAIETADYSEFTNLTIIAAKAFQNCTALTTFRMPNTVTNLGEMAFIGDTALTTVNLSTAIIGSVGDGNGAVVDNGQLVRVFEGCTALESINIPAGVTKLATKLFNGCTNLATVTFADASKIVEIHNYAFTNCHNLLDLPTFENLTVLGMASFQGCRKLTTFAIPEGIKGTEQGYWWEYRANVISQWAFAGCVALENVTIPSTVKTIGGQAFQYTGIKHVVIPANVNNIGYRAFWCMPNIESIRFECTGSNVSVGGDCFQAPYEGEFFMDEDGDGQYTPGEYYIDADNNGYFTTTYPLPSKLTKITFGEGVQKINLAGGYFSRCDQIRTIEFEGTTVPNLGSLTIGSVLWEENIDECKIIVPQGSLATYQAAFADYADIIEEKA